jgi:hypothetical protein
LTRIKNLGDIEDYNSKFQVLATRMDGISDQKLMEAYMGGLKQDIKHEFFSRHPTNIMEAMQDPCHIQAKNKARHKSTTRAYNIDHVGGHKTIIPQPTRLTPHQMEDRRENGLCFNFDNKYSKGHKCNEKKVFYIDNEEE